MKTCVSSIFVHTVFVFYLPSLNSSKEQVPNKCSYIQHYWFIFFWDAIPFNNWQNWQMVYMVITMVQGVTAHVAHSLHVLCMFCCIWLCWLQHNRPLNVLVKYYWLELVLLVSIVTNLSTIKKKQIDWKKYWLLIEIHEEHNAEVYKNHIEKNYQND